MVSIPEVARGAARVTSSAYRSCSAVKDLERVPKRLVIVVIRAEWKVTEDGAVAIYSVRFSLS